MSAPSCVHRSVRRALRFAALIPLAATLSACGAGAQLMQRGPLAWLSSPDSLGLPAGPPTFESTADSLDYERHRAAAANASGMRVIVSRFERRLWVVSGDDTLRTAPAGIGTGETLVHGKRTWRFETPRGKRVVRRKQAEPVWTPPDWHYVEVAQKHGLELKHLDRRRPRRLDDSTTLAVRDSAVGVVDRSGAFWPLSTEEEIVFGDTLFVPPIGTVNRKIPGILGQFMLDMGDGYLLHGTPEKRSIGRAATHGCVRLRDDDIEWIYEMVPVGTPVYIY
jgi:lipoprotein-anchoring transpeptidase ErfK/SrfK